MYWRIPSRVQLVLNVPDIDEAVEFYSKLFATRPDKRWPGYANIAIAEPPLKLVLFEKAGADSRFNHLGVEVESTADVTAHRARLTVEGVAATEDNGTCSFAKQDKVWVDGPDRRLLGDLHRPRGQRGLRSVHDPCR